MERLKIFFAILLVSSASSHTKADSEEIVFTGFNKTSQFTSNENGIGHVFSFYTNPIKTRQGANKTCRMFNGNLADVKTQEIFDHINDELQGYKYNHTQPDITKDFWIGLSRTGSSSEWVWWDGSVLDDSFVKWKESDGDGNCVSASCSDLVSGTPDCEAVLGKWTSVNCITSSRYVCQNEFGDGFISKTNIELQNSEGSVTCTIFGDLTWTVKWFRNDAEIANEATNGERVYQTTEENVDYRNSVLHLVDPTIDDDGVYSCKFYDGSDYLRTENATVAIRGYGNLTQTELQVIDGNGDITCIVYDDSSYNVTWFKDEAEISDDSSQQVYQEQSSDGTQQVSVLHFNNPEYEANRNYTCRFSKNSKIYKTLDAEVVVFGSSYISTDKLDIKDTESEKTISCTIRGDDEYNVVWKRNQENITTSINEFYYQSYASNANSECYTYNKTSVLYFKSKNIDDNGIYTCHLYHSESEIGKLTATITIYGSNEVSTDLLYVEEENNTLTCTIYGDETYTATWNRKGNNVTDDPSEAVYQSFTSNENFRVATLYFNDASYESNGEYICKFTKEGSECGEKNATVIVFGSGFLSETTIEVSSEEKNISCTFFGDYKYSASWTRIGPDISNTKNAYIYQSFKETYEDHSKDNVIYFVNPLNEDSGVYSCQIQRGADEKINVFNATVTIVPFIDEPQLSTENHKISDTSTISCEFRGRPTPNVSWRYNNNEDYLSENNGIYNIQKLINSGNQTTTSNLIITNPISFEKNTSLTCSSDNENGTSISSHLNTDFQSLSGYSYQFKSTDKERCESLNGNQDGEYCVLIASDIENVSANEDEICQGSELVLVAKDFTFSEVNYQMMILSENQLKEGSFSAAESKLKFSELKHQTGYKVQLTYKPTYWTRNVTLTRTFETGGVTPSAMKVENADFTKPNGTKEGFCAVSFTNPEKEEQVQKIQINLKKLYPNGTTENDTMDMDYANPFVFIVTDPNPDYNFTTNFISCSGKVGEESEEAQCIVPHPVPPSSPPTNVAVIVGAVCAVLILLIIILGYLWYKRRGVPLKLKELKQKTIKKKKRKSSMDEIGMADIESTMNTLDLMKSKHWISHGRLHKEYMKLIGDKENELHKQYEEIKREVLELDLPCSEASMLKNKQKNRYQDILPYDETRVQLLSDEFNRNQTDYINANWINGYRKAKRYIAAQGPKPNTKDEFWRMVYENDCRVIVMLTNLIENGRRKCDQYWPSSQRSEVCGKYEIEFENKMDYSSFIVRTFSVKPTNGGATKTVRQYHSTRWPDHGVPEVTSEILQFYANVMSYADQNENVNSPIVVHCSAGVGRTGTFISLDILKQMLEHESYVDFYQVVYNLRLQRACMVQTLIQYKFIHKLIVECFLFGETETSFEEYTKIVSSPERMEKKLKEDFEKLSLIPAKSFVQKPSIRSKPQYGNRSSLHSADSRDANSICNSTCFKNFQDQRKVICAQTPGGDEMEKLFELATSTHVALIVNIDKQNEYENYGYNRNDEDEGSSVECGKFKIETERENSTELGFVVKNLIIRSADMAWKLQQIEIQEWSETKSNVEDNHDLFNRIFKLINQIELLWERNSAVLIHSRDGSTFCGGICALLKIKENLKIENKIDVFRAVKDLRDLKPGSVQNIWEYEVIHEVTKLFIESLQTYVNFQ